MENAQNCDLNTDERQNLPSGSEHEVKRAGHPRILQDHVTEQRKSVKSYQCKWCSKYYSTSEGLSLHIRTHTGEKPYQCTKCEKAFVSKSNLVRHCRVHTGEKPYQCTKCEKAFVDKSTLARHFRIHTGEKTFPMYEM